MVKLAKQLKAAIKQYFDTKKAGNGLFVVPGSKQKCLNDLGLACKTAKVYAEVVPGLIILYWNDKKKHVTAHRQNDWWACRIWQKNGQEVKPLFDH